MILENVNRSGYIFLEILGVRERYNLLMIGTPIWRVESVMSHQVSGFGIARMDGSHELAVVVADADIMVDLLDVPVADETVTLGGFLAEIMNMAEQLADLIRGPACIPCKTQTVAILNWYLHRTIPALRHFHRPTRMI